VLDFSFYFYYYSAVTRNCSLLLLLFLRSKFHHWTNEHVAASHVDMYGVAIKLGNSGKALRLQWLAIRSGHVKLSFAPIYEVDKSGADKKNQSFIIF
jgi:hypothetical protein